MACLEKIGLQVTIIQTVVNLLSTASWRGVWNLLDDAVTQVFIKIITILRIEIIIILTMTSIIIIIINLILRTLAALPPSTAY